MEIEEFRTRAHLLVDWMADYMENVESYSVRAQTVPGQVAATLSDVPPAKSETLDAIMADFERDILQYGTLFSLVNEIFRDSKIIFLIY